MLQGVGHNDGGSNEGGCDLNVTPSQEQVPIRQLLDREHSVDLIVHIRGTALQHHSVAQVGVRPVDN